MRAAQLTSGDNKTPPLTGSVQIVVGASTRRGSSGRIVYHALSQRSPLRALWEKLCGPVNGAAGHYTCWRQETVDFAAQTQPDQGDSLLCTADLQSPSQTDGQNKSGWDSPGASLQPVLCIAYWYSDLDSTPRLLRTLMSQVTSDELCCSGTSTLD